MKTSFAVGLGLVGLGFVLGLAIGGFGQGLLAGEAAPAEAATSDTFEVETLLTSMLEGVEGTEVIVSRVTLPPNTVLPKHWHPGEEYSYLLEGSAVLWQEGEEEITAKQGDVLRVPREKVHSASTSDEGATVLVFWVHDHGQPVRVLVEE